MLPTENVKIFWCDGTDKTGGIIMTTSTVVRQLKQENQDYEMYPSTPEMLRTIYAHMKSNYRMTSILEIGCGTCNFIKYYKEFFGEEHRFQFYGMEKSKILIDALDVDEMF